MASNTSRKRSYVDEGRSF